MNELFELFLRFFVKIFRVLGFLFEVMLQDVLMWLFDLLFKKYRWLGMLLVITWLIVVCWLFWQYQYKH